MLYNVIKDGDSVHWLNLQYMYLWYTIRYAGDGVKLFSILFFGFCFQGYCSRLRRSQQHDAHKMSKVLRKRSNRRTAVFLASRAVDVVPP